MGTAAAGRRSRATPAVPGKHVVRDAGECDRLVEKVVLERLRRPDARDLLTTGRTADTSELHREAKLVRQRLTGLADAYADGDIDAQQLRAGKERLHARLDVIESELATSTRGSVLAGVADAPDPAEVWATLALGRRRAIVDTLVTVTILPGRKGRRPDWKAGESYFDPQTVRIEPRRKKS